MQKMSLKITNEQVRHAFRQEVESQPNNLFDCICQYFSTRVAPSPRSVCSKGMHSDETRKFLLVLDNAEELILTQGKRFAELISRFQDECKTLHIVITSRCPLPLFKDSVVSSVMLIDSLRPNDAVRLFFEATSDQSLGA